MDEAERHRPYLAHLPIGQRPEFDPTSMPGWEIFPFEYDGLRAKVLKLPVFPEPPRQGEDGADCKVCADPLRNAVWSDDEWTLSHTGPCAVPAMVSLQPVAHHDLADLPPALSQSLGPTIQRVERALLALPGTGRVHVNKWGDGGAHLHIWLIARPAGMMQLRGSCLVEWNDILPALPADVWAANLTAIAAALAADGGGAFEIPPHPV